jgi:hypothetical protein
MHKEDGEVMRKKGRKKIMIQKGINKEDIKKMKPLDTNHIQSHKKFIIMNLVFSLF